MSFAILRTAKLKKIGNIVASLNHTLREIDTPNADPNRTALNINSHATTQQALEDIKKRLPEKIREDNVLCIEYLITASPNWNGWHTQKEDEYFKKSIEWLEQKHGKENVIVTSIQRDESTPHLVAYVVPITKNKKGKEILNAKILLAPWNSYSINPSFFSLNSLLKVDSVPRSSLLGCATIIFLVSRSMP